MEGSLGFHGVRDYSALIAFRLIFFAIDDLTIGHDYLQMTDDDDDNRII